MPQSIKNSVWSIFQDTKGTIWFGTDDGLYCYNRKHFSYFLENGNIVNKSNLKLKSVQCMLEDTNGTMWFGSGPMAFEGIACYDGKSLLNFKPQNEGWIRKLAQDKTGNLLFNTRHFGLLTYNGIKNSPQKFKFIRDSKGIVMSLEVFNFPIQYGPYEINTKSNKAVPKN